MSTLGPPESEELSENSKFPERLGARITRLDPNPSKYMQ